MSQHGLNADYRERVAAALIDLVDASATDSLDAAARPRPQQRRAIWVTAAVAVALLPLLLIAVIAPLRSQTINAIGASGLLPICSSEVVAPFDCHEYLLTEGEPDVASSAIQNAVAWFEKTPSGQVRMTIEVNDRWIQVPITERTATSATGQAIEDGISARLDCTPDSSCSLQADLGNLFSQPTTFTVTGEGFTVSNGTTVYTGTKTAAIHRPAVVKIQQSNGRTLLTYTPLSDISNAAYNGGDLAVGARGCVAAGGRVLVLPEPARLNSDGTIDFDGRQLTPGQPAKLSGGNGPIPANTPCGLDVDYWWAGTL